MTDQLGRERIAEIGEILAAGLMRLGATKSSRKWPETGESSLDFSAIKSGHPTPTSDGG
jgi:hypothetical protein